MKIVLDTNILLVSVSEFSKTHWVFQVFIKNDFELCITNDILLEYIEIFQQNWDEEITESTIELILKSDNTRYITNFFLWNIITADPDDNKFVDCAVAANADYIVTEDLHFNALKRINFPKVNVVNLKQFKKILNK